MYVMYSCILGIGTISWRGLPLRARVFRFYLRISAGTKVWNVIAHETCVQDLTEKTLFLPSALPNQLLALVAGVCVKTGLIRCFMMFVTCADKKHFQSCRGIFFYKYCGCQSGPPCGLCQTLRSRPHGDETSKPTRGKFIKLYIRFEICHCVGRGFHIVLTFAHVSNFSCNAWNKNHVVDP